MDIALLETTMADRGEPAYRTRQVWEWAARGAEGYEAMTNVPAKLREALAESVPYSTLTVAEEQQAKDGTVKTLFRTHDGHPVEAVLMRYRDGRRTICISSQSGCPLTCTFCATGAMQFGRNLTTSEILDQALHFRRLEAVGSFGEAPKPSDTIHPSRGGGASPPTNFGRAPNPRDTIHPSRGGGASPPTNCVFMGMGEPFLNFDNVIAAARRLPDVGITHRRTTVSTVGWLPGLTRFVDEVEEPIRLALSLHAANPALRSQLMPVNDRYALPDVLAECRRYVELRGRKVYIEYVMLEGVNDTTRHAAELAAILDAKCFKVNLIPSNPTGMYGGSSRDAIAAFKHVLDRARIPATVRLTRGRDIAAACGQLAAEPRPVVHA
jgi:23S rRNA (adenine2503-C2)-methyltransferase